MDTRTGEIKAVEDIPAEEKDHFIPVKRRLSAKEKAQARIDLYSPCGCGSGKKFKFCCKK